MTNAEKFLKDGADKHQFAKEIQNCFGKEIPLVDETILDWLADDSHPKLTEDERVILRNIDTDNYKGIGRKNDTLYLVSATPNYFGGENDKEVFWYCFHELFQFIKERGRI